VDGDVNRYIGGCGSEAENSLWRELYMGGIDKKSCTELKRMSLSYI
jgi:hypothetical protein